MGASCGRRERCCHCHCCRKVKPKCKPKVFKCKSKCKQRDEINIHIWNVQSQPVFPMYEPLDSLFDPSMNSTHFGYSNELGF